MDTEYLQYRAADFISKVLPRPFAYWVGLRVADGFYRRDHRGRAAVISNLRHILEHQGIRASEETLENMARKTFQYFGKYLVDFFRFRAVSRRLVNRLISIEHLDYVDQAAATGRGVLVVSAHLGSWEIGAAALVSMGYPMNAVVLEQGSKKTNALFQRRRQSRGFKAIPLGRAVRGIMKALRQKEFVALLADRDYSRRNDMVPLFGTPTRLPMGPATLCVRLQAPILPGFMMRQADDTFLLRFSRPIVPDSLTTVDDVQAQICAVLEQAVGKDPCQWFMFDEFWAQENGDDDRDKQ
jgi:KDO2-lipid IV(A) lauroyltransferase